MMPFQIKICGVTNVDDAVFAVRHGADAIGLNFFEKSSRYVCPPNKPTPGKPDAAPIVAAVRGFAQSENIPTVKLVGVFVNLTVQQIVDIAVDLGLDGIQLHGDEPASYVEKIRETIKPSSTLIVRAVRTNPRDQQESDPAQEIARIESEIAEWALAGVDAALLDAAVAGEFGGTGKSVDWHAVPEINATIPLILAGGLTASNVSEAIRIADVKAVDVASGVESAPGEKSDPLVKQFIESAKSSLS